MDMNPALLRFAQMAMPGGRPPPQMPGGGGGLNVQLPQTPAMPPQNSAPVSPAEQGQGVQAMPQQGVPQMPPQGGMPGQPGQMPMSPQMIDPRGVIRPAQAAAQAGRKGDSMVAHLTPGDVVVPRQIREDPRLTKMLNAAFIAHGANPTAFEAGNPDASINPQTGLQEFGFLDFVLPAVGALTGGWLLGPALAPVLGATAGGIVGSGLGSTVGGIIAGKDPLLAAAGGFGGAAASGLVDAALPATAGLSEVSQSVPSVSSPLAAASSANPTSAATSALNVAARQAADVPAAASGFNPVGDFLNNPFREGTKALAGYVGGNLAESMVSGAGSSSGAPTEEEKRLMTPEQLRAKYPNLYNRNPSFLSPTQLATYGSSGQHLFFNPAPFA